MITPGKYYPGTTMSLTAAFANANGELADPASVVFKTYSPRGDTNTYTYGTDDNVSKVGTGSYAASFVVPNSGRWRARWEGTDAIGNVIVIEDKFNVQASKFEGCHYPGWDYR